MDLNSTPVYPLFRTTSRVSWPDSDDEPPDWVELESDVEDFVALHLASISPPQRQRAVEVYVETFRWSLNRNGWLDVYEHFKACLDYQRLPPCLCDVVYYNLPCLLPSVQQTANVRVKQLRLTANASLASDLAQVSEDGAPVATESSDSASQAVSEWITRQALPEWFTRSKARYSMRTRLIRLHPTKKREPPPSRWAPSWLRRPPLEDLHEWREDLLHMLKAFETCSSRLHRWILEMSDWDNDSESHLRTEALNLLSLNPYSMSAVRLPRYNDMCPSQVEDLCMDGAMSVGHNMPLAEWPLTEAERLLVEVKERCFLAEAYLATDEAQTTLIFGIHRRDLATVIVSLNLGRLQRLFQPYWGHIEPIDRPYRHEDCCSICHDELPAGHNRRGEKDGPRGTPFLTVTYECCHKPFHTYCILQWLLSQAASVSCPMCREPVKLTFLREVMEMGLYPDQQRRPMDADSHLVLPDSFELPDIFDWD